MTENTIFTVVGLIVFFIFKPQIITSQTHDRIDFIQPSDDSFVVKLDEDTAIGKVIYTLKAAGGTPPLTFSIQTSQFKADVVPVDDVTAEVVLKQKLDAKGSYSFTCYVKDSVGLESDTNPVGHFDVKDINDNPPYFEDYQAMYQIEENFSPPNDLIFTLNATDLADTQELGTAGIIFEFELKDDLNKHLFRSEQRRSESEAIFELYLAKQLDYEQNVMHRITVTAFDNNKQPKFMTATAAIVINVVDVDDNGPVFTKIPPFTKLNENTLKDTKVLEVEAVDGDRNVKHPIRYSIVKGNENNTFRIDETTGEVFVENSPDREQLTDDEVEMILSIMAQEVNTGRMSTETVNCTVVIQDLNDEEPKFELTIYRGSIDENSFVNTAITLDGFDFITVIDKDQSQNAAFTVFLTTHENLFNVNPTSGVNEGFLSLRVKNSKDLDYETLGSGPLIVKIKSEDKNDKSLTGEAIIEVKINDVNDLYPIFTQNRYNSSIKEDLAIDQLVLTVKAFDNDTGVFGNDGIRYSIQQFNMPFKVHSVTGDVTLNSLLDREKVSEYSFTVTARDDDGNGNSNSCEVFITVLDVNDNRPEFTSSNYRAVVKENEAKFQNQLLIRAIDKDLKENGKVNYRITKTESETETLTNDYFDLVSVSDDVEMIVIDANKMDYEELCSNIPVKCSLKVTIEAYDGGNPSLNEFTVVEITLLDENDEIPKFIQKKFDINLLENDKSGSLVAKVSATDDDVTPDFHQISYEIIIGSTQLFRINSSTGVITVGTKANLDLDKIETDHFELSVIASDRKYRENNDVCKINVKIVDVNNKPPYFDGSSYETNINENSILNSELNYELRASDPDTDFQLEYSFGPIKAFSPDKRAFNNESYYNNLFEIDPNNGKITVKSQLDRETVEKLIMTLIVNDTKTIEGKSSATVSLTIHIDDYNDNAPLFGEKDYRGSVKENAEFGTEIRPVVTAIDIDLNQNIVFSLSGEPEFLRLVEISKNGLLTVKANIDREVYSSFFVTVIATDDGQPQMSSSMIYNLTVLDVNDNKPEFKPLNYQISIKEDAEIDFFVLKVLATDLDSGDFGKINFDFDQSKGQANFRIDNETGEIFIVSELDRDNGNDVIEFGVLARDNIKNPLQSLTSTATVTVTLLDVNDNAPVINPVKDCVNVYEDTSKLPHDLVTVTGSDPDYMENGAIVFYLADNNTQQIKNLFDIKPKDDKSYILFVHKSLKKLIGIFEIIVTAKDKGNDVKFTEKMEIINVCVIDVNDHNPVIHYPTTSDKIARSENLEVKNDIVFQINATDDDVDEDNKRLIYTIKSFEDTFQVDQEGKVTLLKKFNREITKWYEVNFEVCDSGKPAPLCTSGSCRVIVKNLHNKQPEFKLSQHQILKFTEETDPGLESNDVIDAIDDDHDISGLPHDLAEEQKKEFLDICYFIVGGDVNSFELNKMTRTIKSRVIFDYEIKNEYKLIIIATNECETIPPGVGADVDEGNLNRNYLIVKIEIIDVNDNPPKFTQSIFGGGIDNSATPGKILQLNAIDEDSGVNTKVRYEISSDITIIQGENINTDEKKNSWFILDENDGFVSSNYQFSENMKGYAQFDVKVENVESLVKAKVNNTYDTALVKIYILRNDQKSIFIIRKSKDDFWSTREEFSKKLSNLTGTIAHINSVVPYVDPITSITRPEWCVVSVHYINTDNDVIDPSTIEEFLDTDYMAQSQLANEFAVHEVNKQIDSKKTQEMDPITTSIYAVCAALILILTAFLTLYCSRVSKLKLQLKASSLSTYSAMNRKQSLAPELPTTNLHSKLASNPIFELDEGDLHLNESSDALSIVSEGSLINNENNFEGGLNNGGFAGLLENMIGMENDEKIDTSKSINDNFVMIKSGGNSPESIFV